MSFVEDLEKYGDGLLRLVDGGVGVAAACGSLGISRGRGYEILRAVGRGTGKKTVITAELRDRVIAVFGETGSVNRGAIAAGLSHDAA